MKFSIVTISFNQGRFLERTIRSVIAQKGVDLEYIVVDPGSTDDSREIIERYRRDITRVVFEKDRGPADGLNKGFACASGEIYGYLNADDVFEPGALRRVAAYFERLPDVDVVCGHCWVTDFERCAPQARMVGALYEIFQRLWRVGPNPTFDIHASRSVSARGRLQH